MKSDDLSTVIGVKYSTGLFWVSLLYHKEKLAKDSNTYILNKLSASVSNKSLKELTTPQLKAILFF